MSLESYKALCLRHYREVLTEKHLDVVDQIYGGQMHIGDGGQMPRDQLREDVMTRLPKEIAL